VSTKHCWVIKMPDDDSTKDSWVSKNLLSQQKSTDSANMLCQQNLISQHKYMVTTQQKYAISTKIWQVSEMNWFSKEYAVSAKLAYYLIVTPTLGLGLVLYYDVMYLVTVFSNRNYVVSAKLAESAKSTGLYAVSATMCCFLDRRCTLTRRWPTGYRVWTLTGIWFLSAAAARTSTVVLSMALILMTWVYIKSSVE